MKKNKKNYEVMVNGFLESLKDYDWKSYSVLKFSHDSYYTDRAAKAVSYLHDYYSHFEDFLTKQELKPRVERIWVEQIPYKVKRVSMAYWESGITRLNIVRSVESFTKIFQEICRFFSWNGTDEYKIKIGDTLKDCIKNLNEYFHIVKVIHFSGPERIMEFLIVLGNITREMYIDCINNFPKMTELHKDKLDAILSTIDPETIERYAEFHTEEDKEFLKRLGYTRKSLKDELKVEFHDTGLDTILVHYPKDLDDKVSKLKEMRERWRDEYNKAHPYVYKSPSYAHEEALAASFDLFSDD